ncbi:hypothetical protein [Rossellomorea aquimaris]|uniref:Thymidylate kinase n=1 Tax=Rossellomorea aquimaris TaxID=189382 RepID=A0A1J6W6P2_9BACI|nr:hypothetical protein [Rossellomorea aquimaris]OIU73266.1 hypothetical protein BHE18_14470 [Rossellomorea aquimaris]
MSGRVIFVEGIPGAGKTSTVQKISHFLKGKGIPVKEVVEGNLEQPADYERAAFLTEDQLKSIEEEYGIDAGSVSSYCEILEHGMLVHYERMSESEAFSESFIKELEQFDIYNTDPDTYILVIKHKWRLFKELLAGTDDVYVLDCSLLQNPLTFLIAKNDMPAEFIKTFVIDLLMLVKEYRPLVVYLEPKEIKKALEHVMAERSEQWFTFVRDYYTKQKYGINHNLTNDLDGIMNFLEERVTVEKSILKDSGVDWLHIERDQASWRDVITKIEDELNLRFVKG